MGNTSDLTKIPHEYTKKSLIQKGTKRNTLRYPNADLKICKYLHIKIICRRFHIKHILQ